MTELWVEQQYGASMFSLEIVFVVFRHCWDHSSVQVCMLEGVLAVYKAPADLQQTAAEAVRR